MDKKIQIKTKKFDLVSLDEFKGNPKNPNTHSSFQIERLVKLFEYQGIRHPIVVSNQTGYIVAGHGRLQAALKAGMQKFPVDYQDFDSEEQEYAHMVADNAISEWAELNKSMIDKDIIDLGPDFDLDNLGILDFRLDLSEIDHDKEWEGMPEFEQKDKTAYQTVQLHLYDKEAVIEFMKLIQQPITEKTRTIWFPAQTIERAADKRYGSES